MAPSASHRTSNRRDSKRLARLHFSSSCVCALRQWPKPVIACICAPDRITHAEKPPNESSPLRRNGCGVWARVCVVILAAMRVMMGWPVFCFGPTNGAPRRRHALTSLFAASLYYEDPSAPSSPGSTCTYMPIRVLVRVRVRRTHAASYEAQGLDSERRASQSRCGIYCTSAPSLNSALWRRRH
ncbi:hypothetical protein V8C26DRAFT_206026 [Trichoderma gracile]